MSLDRDRAFEATLIAAARSAEVMLVVAGKAWDRGRNRQRLDEDAGWRIVLVLVERDSGPIDMPDALEFLRGCEVVALGRPDMPGKLAAIADTITGAPTARAP